MAYNSIYTGAQVEALLAKADTALQLQDISDKVDKIEGMGLSTNDYTTAEKNKLAGLANIAITGSYDDLTNTPQPVTLAAASDTNDGFASAYDVKPS